MWGRGAPHGERAHERRDLGQSQVLGLGEGEARLLDGRERRPVAVAAHDEPVQPVQPVLAAGQREIAGTDVLDEE